MDNREDDNRPEDEVTPADTDSDDNVEQRAALGFRGE